MKNYFTPDSIKWIKNVTSPDLDSAYLKDIRNDTFLLHFPKKHKGNVLKSSIGEIIVLYQKIRNKNVFTHFVTPIDKNLIVDNKGSRYPFGRWVRILAKTDNAKAISIEDTVWSQLDFRGISQGNACEIKHINNIDNIDSYLIELWQLFKPFFLKDYSQNTEIVQDAMNQALLDDKGVKEGALKLITHFTRERKSSQLVRQKKEQAKAQGKYDCALCNFSFVKFYKIDYIECHHIIPIFQVPEDKTVETKLIHLMLVCANCHKMLHKKINGRFLSVEELKKRIKGAGSN